MDNGKQDFILCVFVGAILGVLLLVSYGVGYLQQNVGFAWFFGGFLAVLVVIGKLYDVIVKPTRSGE